MYFTIGIIDIFSKKIDYLTKTLQDIVNLLNNRLQLHENIKTRKTNFDKEDASWSLNNLHHILQDKITWTDTSNKKSILKQQQLLLPLQITTYLSPIVTIIPEDTMDAFDSYRLNNLPVSHYNISYDKTIFFYCLCIQNILLQIDETLGQLVDDNPYNSLNICTFKEDNYIKVYTEFPKNPTDDILKRQLLSADDDINILSPIDRLINILPEYKNLPFDKVIPTIPQNKKNHNAIDLSTNNTENIAPINDSNEYSNTMITSIKQEDRGQERLSNQYEIQYFDIKDKECINNKIFNRLPCTNIMFQTNIKEDYRLLQNNDIATKLNILFQPLMLKYFMYMPSNLHLVPLSIKTLCKKLLSMYKGSKFIHDTITTRITDTSNDDDISKKIHKLQQEYLADTSFIKAHNIDSLIKQTNIAENCMSYLYNIDSYIKKQEYVDVNEKATISYDDENSATTNKDLECLPYEDLCKKLITMYLHTANAYMSKNTIYKAVHRWWLYINPLINNEATEELDIQKYKTFVEMNIKEMIEKKKKMINSINEDNEEKEQLHMYKEYISLGETLQKQSSRETCRLFVATLQQATLGVIELDVDNNSNIGAQKNKRRRLLDTSHANLPDPYTIKIKLIDTS